MVRITKVFYFLIPVLIVLIIDTITVTSNIITDTLGWISLPGFAIWVVLNPTWEGMHNYNNWTIFAFNLIFYFALFYFIITIYSAIRNRSTKNESL